MPAYNFDNNPDLENIYSNILLLEDFVRSVKPEFKNISGVIKMFKVGAALKNFFKASGFNNVNLADLTDNENLIESYQIMQRAFVNDFPDHEFEFFALNSAGFIDSSEINPVVSDDKLQKYIDREIKLYIEEGVSQEGAETQAMDNLAYVCGKLYTYSRECLDTIENFLILAEKEMDMG